MQETEVKVLICKIALEGDVMSYKLLYNFYYQKLFKLAKTITRSTEASEEIVNDVFMKIWMDKHKLLEIDNLTVYLYVLVKNSSLNFIKRLKNQPNIGLEDLNIEIKDYNPSPESKLISNENVVAINQVIQKLPAQCKIIFKMAKEDGLKYKEIADIMDISVKTVEYHIGLALKRISEQLPRPLFIKNHKTDLKG